MYLLLANVLEVFGALLTWPASVLLLVVAAVNVLTDGSPSLRGRLVHELSVPVMASLAAHTALAAIALVLRLFLGPAQWDSFVASLVVPIHATTSSWLISLSMCVFMACALNAALSQHGARRHRRVATLVAGLAVFALFVPLQAQRAGAQLETDEHAAWLDAQVQAVHARGELRFAVALRTAAETVREDVARLTDDDGSRLAETFGNLESHRARLDAERTAFALGVVDALGGGDVRLDATCLTADCFTRMVPATLGARERASVDPGLEGQRREHQWAAAARHAASNARSQAVDAFVARLSSPLDALEASPGAHALARAYLAGAIDIHAARLALDGVAVPPMPVRSAISHHAATRARFDHVDAQVQARLTGEVRATQGCRARLPFRPFLSVSWRCRPMS